MQISRLRLGIRVLLNGYFFFSLLLAHFLNITLIVFVGHRRRKKDT